MIREPAPKDGALLAMLLDAAILVVIAAARWHQLRQHDQQVAAAHQTPIHLQAAYEHTAVAPLTALAQRRPPQQVVQRHILLIHQTMPDHAKQVAEDPSFDALTAVLAAAEKAGHDPKQLFQQASDERALDDARSPAQVLTWRVERLSARPVPSERARVARIRSATRWSVAPRETVEPSAQQAVGEGEVLPGQGDDGTVQVVGPRLVTEPRRAGQRRPETQPAPHRSGQEPGRTRRRNMKVLPKTRQPHIVRAYFGGSHIRYVLDKNPISF